MTPGVLSPAINRQIDDTVDYYCANRTLFDNLLATLYADLQENQELRDLIHSIKVRTKDRDHLLDKLQRQATRAAEAGRPYVITPETLFEQIEDLAGLRILHLHTKQFAKIHSALMEVFGEHHYRLLGKPSAYTWDIENQAYFGGLGLKVVMRPTMYTSVHYIIEPNRRTHLRCEVQVRTLMEEVWGEVSHKINYPHETKSIACQEQLRALARIASGCTRLVDSIFSSHQEHLEAAGKPSRTTPVIAKPKPVVLVAPTTTPFKKTIKRILRTKQ